MTAPLPPCPESLKGIQHFLSIAAEHDGRDGAVSYWCRLHALQKALKIDKSSDAAKFFLLKLMDWLEHEKKTHHDNETITNETAAQAYIENYALKLFHWADTQDRSSVFNKNVVKAFYTSSILMDVLQIFGETSDEIVQNQKYAKWKAAYIHNCLKNGETPVPGPQESAEGSSEGPGIDSPNSNQLPSPSNENSNENVTPSYPAPNTAGGYFPSPTSQETLPEPASSPSSGIPSFPTSQPLLPTPTKQPEQDVTHIEADLINKCQKYIKFASSALNYDDYNEAKTNLIKALNILNTGRES